MPILRQGVFIQFESSQKMNGVFVALLLRDVKFLYFRRRRTKKNLSTFSLIYSSMKDVVQ